MPCHWLKDNDDDMILIPGCWGSIQDPSACTCEVEGSQLERAEYARASAEREIERLKGKLYRQHELYLSTFNMNRRLHQRINETEST